MPYPLILTDEQTVSAGSYLEFGVEERMEVDAITLDSTGYALTCMMSRIEFLTGGSQSVLGH